MEEYGQVVGCGLLHGQQSISLVYGLLLQRCECIRFIDGTALQKGESVPIEMGERLASDRVILWKSNYEGLNIWTT